MIKNKKDFELFCKYNMYNKNFKDIRKNFKDRDKILNDLYYSAFLQRFDTKRDFYKNPPKFLVLMHGSYACNLNCVYCENHKLRENYKAKIMSEDIAIQVINKLGPIIRELTWHGGEPTLLPDSLLETVENERQRLGLDFRTTLQSNGVLLMSKEKRKKLKDLNITWGTSFDGLDNNRNRGEKSTEAILNLFSLPEDERPNGFITVYLKDTAQNMIDNYEYYKTINVKNFQSCIVRENVVENTNPYLITVQKSVDSVLEYLDYWIHDTNNPIVDAYLTRQIQRVLGYTHICEDANCIGGWIIIDPFGNIGLCGQSSDEANLVNIKDIKDYNDFIYSPKYLNIINKQKRLISKCKTHCPWYHVCYGGCMGSNYEYDPTYSEVNPRICQYTIALLEGIYEKIKNIDINDTEHYNPLFLTILKNNNYFSLDEIKNFEAIKEFKNAKYCNE